MVLINYATKEIVAKIVYYGPALCGKTTNLQVVYTKLNPRKRGKMISLATESDRTLFFDFLPMELGTVQGFKIRFQLYTVPGQVRYGATRKLVLKGADAIVFVADSQEALLGSNMESIEDMKQNLVENGLDPDTIPLVMQYNKRDLDGVMDVDDLERELNWRGVPSFEAEAVNGPGVMETLLEVTRLLIKDMKAKHSNINTDKIKDLKMDAFLPEEEKEKEKELEPEDFVLEIDRGYGYEQGGEDVVAGELLDQIETISMDNTSQAEHFFDDIRKGTATEEAAEKAVSVEPVQDDSDFIVLDDNVSVYAGGKDAGIDVPVGEIELSPDDLDGAAGMGMEMELDPVVEPVSKDSEPALIEPEPEPEPKPKSKTKAKKKPKPPPPPPPPSFEPDDTELFGDVGTTAADILKQPEAAPKDETPASEVFEMPAAPSVPAAEPVDLSGIESRLDDIKDAVSRLEKEVGILGKAAATAAAGPVSGEYPAPSGDMAFPPAVEMLVSKLGESVERIEQEVSGLRLSMTLAKEQGGGQGGASAGAGELSQAVSEMFDEFKREFLGAMEGQDKLLLKVLESIRESKRAVMDGHEKQDDALKYIIDRVTEEGGGQQGKKKWF